jgi:hypothetical protein
VAQRQTSQPAIDQVADRSRAASPERGDDDDDDRLLTWAASVMSQPLLNAIWDNPVDAEYDRS